MSTGLHDMCWDCRQSGNRNSPNPLLKNRDYNTLQDVSLIQLIAQPEKFEGKRVRFIGFLRLS